MLLVDSAMDMAGVEPACDQLTFQRLIRARVYMSEILSLLDHLKDLHPSEAASARIELTPALAGATLPLS